MDFECVARFVEGAVMCGPPGVEWGEGDVLPEGEVTRRRERGDCKRCLSRTRAEEVERIQRTLKTAVACLMAFMFWGSLSFAGETSGLEDMGNTAVRVEEAAKGIRPPEVGVKGEMENLARELVKSHQGEKAKTREAEEGLKSGIFKPYLEKSPSVARDGKIAPWDHATGTDRVYLFVSSSMPVVALRNYSADVAKLGGGAVMVLRGLKGGIGARWRPTMAFVGAVLNEDEGCDIFKGGCKMRPAPFQIDPLLFKRYGITRVPAAVYVRGLKMADGALSEGLDGNSDYDAAWTAHGDASLGALLEGINRQAESAWLEGLIGRLKE